MAVVQTSPTLLGNVGINPQGEYSSGTAYERLDVVTYNGSGYICIQDCVGQPVTNTSYWYLLASKGDTYEVTEEDLQRIATQIEEDASSLFNQLVAQKTSEFNANATQKTQDFNTNATQKTSAFDSNATSKTTTFNNNASSKTSDFNTNATQKGVSFDANYDDKLGLFNGNATTKTNDYNDNASAKTTAYNSNASSKTTTFNNNATDKTNAFNTNAEEKTEDFDEHVASYTSRLEEVEDVSEVNANHIRALEDNFDVATSTNSNDYTITDSASGYNKGNIKLGDREIEQYSTTGAQLFDDDLQNVLEMGSDYVSISKIENGFRVTVVETGAYKGRRIVIPNSNSLLGKTATLSGNIIGTNGAIRIFAIDNVGNTRGDSIASITATGTKSFSFPDSYPAGGTKFAILLHGSFMQSSPVGTTIDYTNIMLNEGSTALPIEQYTGGQPSPSPDYPQNINVIMGESEVDTSNKNLFDYTDATTVTTGIITDTDGWITVTYDNSSSSSAKYFNYFTNNLHLQTNKTYTIVTEIKNVSGEGRLYPVSHYENEGQFSSDITLRFSELSNLDVKVVSNTTFTSFDNISNGLRTIVRLDAGQRGSVTFRISVLEDLTITPQNFKYTPHKGKSFPVTLPQNMFLGKIGNSSNYIYGTKDNWKLHSGLGKVVLNGTEGWSLTNSQPDDTTLKSVATDLPGRAIGTPVMSNLFKYMGIGNATTIKSITFSAVWINQYSTQYGFVSKYLNVNDWENFLSQNNPELYYSLQTSTDINITDTTLISQLNNIADNLETYKGGTIVFTTSENLEPAIQFDYMVNPFASVETRLTEVEQALVALNSNN